MKLLLVFLVSFLLAGCSAPDWQRLGYETLESVRQQQCRQQTSSGPEWAECQRRVSYADYQRARKGAGQ